MIYHRKWSRESQSDEVLKKQLSSKEIWGFPKRNTYHSHYPSVKAWPGPLPADAEGGIEFETSIPLMKGIPPGRPEWERNPPDVRDCTAMPDCVCITVTVKKYQFYKQQVVIL